MQNWAILIGVDKYRHQNRLRNAVADAKLVYRTLAVDYGFKRSNINCLSTSYMQSDVRAWISVGATLKLPCPSS